jgi:NAD(P)-dependent dehydrogenase (short-subunit alcohol dehydrogenase family)
MRLKDKVAIVTGSASGLGKAMAVRMAAEGATVVVNDVNPEAMQKVVAEIENAGGKAIGIKGDVTKKPEMAALMEEAVGKLGKIDILVNNAGVTRHRAFLEMTDEDWAPVINVDLIGVFKCCQAVAPYMMKQRHGKIINISSAAGTGASSDGSGNFNYVAAKAGVIQMTKMLAREFGTYGVNVNSVAPGFILTPISYTRRSEKEVQEHSEHRKAATCLKRSGSPEDIANAVLFLASDESDFITGQLLCVDGGRTDHL